LKTTQIYGKIMDQSKDEAMSRFNGLFWVRQLSITSNYTVFSWD